MRTIILAVLCIVLSQTCFCWGFYGHRKINELAVYLLPPEMLVFYKQHLPFLAEHAVDPDKRRYALAEEGPRHYLDLDHYGAYPYTALPRNWDSAVAKYSEDSLMAHGIVPWWVQVMLQRLTKAFREKNQSKILKFSADIGHYIADAHVPLHASHNHNGQYTGQHGIHGFWESRVPELLAERQFDFWIGKAQYLKHPDVFIWERLLESGAASDTVLRRERELTAAFPADQKYAFENRNGLLVRVYSSAFTKSYEQQLNGMVERRMRQSIFAVASFWFTAWVNAGQPNLKDLNGAEFSKEEQAAFEQWNEDWKNGREKGRSCN